MIFKKIVCNYITYNDKTGIRVKNTYEETKPDVHLSRSYLTKTLQKRYNVIFI